MLWGVNQYALQAVAPDGTIHAVDSHVANVRTADCDGQPINEILGIVGADYQVCQNRELAEFTDALAQTGQVTIESCGSIRGGKRVWFLARGESFDVGGADKVYPYVLVSNGHDGTQAIRVTPTTVRVVCSNTLHMVIPQEDGTRPESAAITIRHSGKIADKLEQAKRALRYYGNTLARNRELFETMQAAKMDRDQALQVFSDSYSAFWEVATPEELASADAKQRRNAENRVGRMRKASDAFLARYAAEQEKLGLADSAWLAFNAMTGYVQHDKGARGANDSARVERRRESNLFGLNAHRTHEILAGTLALAS
jgi:phage/plasmid-like protein (TIGR03299 family)